MAKIKYKVVSIRNCYRGHFFVSSECPAWYPSTIDETENSWVMAYKKGRWVEAKIGGLLVFDSLNHAKEYQNADTVIFKCEVKKKVELPQYGIMMFFFLCDLDRLQDEGRTGWEVLQDFWAQPNKLAYRSYLHQWPAGTEAYRKVKLIEEVKL